MKAWGPLVDQGVIVNSPAQPEPSVDNESFEEFYRRELPGQVRRAALLLGSATVANDAVHDAFIAVFGRWGTLLEPGPYLNRCVLNRCRDLERHRRAAPGEVLPLFVSDRSEEVALWDALRRLPFRQRAALVMRYWQGMDETQIADALRVRPGTVGSLLSRGKRTIERRWER